MLSSVSPPDGAIEHGTPPLLCGKVSRDIKQEIEKLTGNPRMKKLRWFSECLSVSIIRNQMEKFPLQPKRIITTFCHYHTFTCVIPVKESKWNPEAKKDKV